MKPQNLTKKQEDFCQAYMKLGDKSAAYREVYACRNMKPESVNRLAFALFSNIKITSRLTVLQEKAAIIAEKKFNITSETILRHLDILRNARIDEFVTFVYEKVETDKTDNDGEPIFTEVPRMIFKPFSELTPEQLMCIESIKQNRYGEIELKLHGKEWTIEKINKHIGFYEKDNIQRNKIMTTDDREERIRKLEEKAKAQ